MSRAQLVLRGLVMEEDEDVFAFRHALTADAVAEGLLSRERRALHARVVDTLETVRRDDESALDQLAYHAYAAADCLDDEGRFDRARWGEHRKVFETHVVED